MDAETKTCPHCAETIKAAAKRCPRCTSGLVKVSAATWLNITWAWLVLCCPLLLVAWWLRDVTGTGERFEPHRDKLRITETSMHYSQSGETNFISTVGYIQNGSDYAWKSLQLEAQYFDANDKLIDAKTETLTYQEIPAGITTAFRIRTIAAKDRASYASQKIQIRTAKDARGLRDAEE